MNARQVVVYLCRELTELSLPQIGHVVGGRHHTTVIHADRKVRQHMAERGTLFHQITELTSIIRARSGWQSRPHPSRHQVRTERLAA